MRSTRTALLALALLVGSFGALIAQAPPVIPSLPDTTRVTTYSVSATTCACSVGFAIYGDSTDVDEWIEVYVGATKYPSTDPTFGWGLTSATGSLGSIARPITDAVLTFNATQTATVTIVGSRRPRRVSQFSENRGVPARDLNQAITDLVAMARELWDKANRSIVGQPGDVLTPLPSAASRAGKILSFDSSGNPLPIPTPSGSGNVNGPGLSVNNNVACWNGTTGLTLKDCGSLGTGNVVGPASAVDSHFAVYDGTTGKLIKDGGVVGTLATSSTISASQIATSAAAFGINMINGTIVPTNATNALTFTIKTLAGATPSASDPVLFVFRSATASAGTYSVISVTAALSVTVPASSTLGFSNAAPGRIWLTAINNAGAVELAVINVLSGSSIYPLAGWGIVSTTAFGGGANNAQTMYSTSSRANVPFSVLGYGTYEVGSTIATAGTWNANPTRLELYRPGVPLPGSVVQTAVSSTTSVGSTTSASLVALTSGQTQAITPTSSANLVRVMASGSMGAASSANMFLQLARGSTLIGNPVTWQGAGFLPVTILVLDAPQAITSQTYQFQAKTSASTFNYPTSTNGNSGAILELQEIMGALPEPANDNCGAAPQMVA